MVKKPWWFRDSVWCEEEEGKGGFDWIVDPVLITKGGLGWVVYGPREWAGLFFLFGLDLVLLFIKGPDGFSSNKSPRTKLVQTET